MKVFLRDRSPDDAQRFWEILNNPNFLWFSKPPETVEGERAYIIKDINRPMMSNHTIICQEFDVDTIVGGVGVKVNQHRPWVAELGYFVDEAYWGRGIGSRALKFAENLCWVYDFYGPGRHIERVELIIDPDNTRSRRLAEGSGYTEEGLLKGILRGRDGQLHDGIMYGKLLS